MTTEELLWNAAYEHDQDLDDSYSYEEEWRKECYYEDKERLDRLSEFFKQAG